MTDEAPKTADDRLEKLIRYFEETEEATIDSRALSERDRDYFDGKQWTPEEEAELKKRKQPIIVINRVRRLINFLKGMESQGSTDPKAFPRTPKDQDGAHAATDALRYVEENQNLDAKFERCWEEFLVEGSCSAEVTVEPKGDDFDIVVKRWAWDRSFIDPHSSELDGSDARFMGGLAWMDVEDAADIWPDAREAFEFNLKTSTFSETYDDKPKFKVWADRVRKRVRIVQMYYREAGQWHWCIFTKGAKIRGGVVPYLDTDGKPENPMKWASAYIDRDNNRYGAVRDMISPQDEINKRRSKLLHQLNMRQTLGEQGSVLDKNRMKRELAKPDGHIEITPDTRFEILNNNDQIAGQAQLLAEAKAEIDGMGPNAALAGRGTEEQSGRAIIAQQQGGLVEIAPLRNQFTGFKREIYRAIWNRIKQFWTAEKWVRVTDDENAPRFIGLNIPVTNGQIALNQLATQGASQQEMMESQAIVQADPRFQQVVGIENNVAEMEVDIIIEATPDTVTAAQEQFDTLASLAQGGVPIPPDVLIEAAPGLRNKARLLERMTGADNPQLQQQQRQAAQLQTEDAIAEIREKNASAAKDEATAAEKLSTVI